MRTTNTAKSENTFKKPVLITQNSVMKDLLDKVKLVAKTNATVLIMGENGTGKEVLAQLVHYHSDRNAKPMISINCGAIPSELVESELFGHEKGAFTGAHIRKEGCFEQADNGTLFLDEIGEMPKSIQVKLLRAVEVGSFRRVGGKEEIETNFSLISAPNKVLIDEVKAGEFREDLFYRINVIELTIPPLRERKEDITLLVDYYNSYFEDKYNSEQVEFTQECIDTFMNYHWPGNVRELKNVVERCFIFANNKKVDLTCIPPNYLEAENFTPPTKKQTIKMKIQFLFLLELASRKLNAVPSIKLWQWWITIKPRRQKYWDLAGKHCITNSISITRL